MPGALGGRRRTQVSTRAAPEVTGDPRVDQERGWQRRRTAWEAAETSQDLAAIVEEWVRSATRPEDAARAPPLLGEEGAHAADGRPPDVLRGGSGARRQPGVADAEHDARGRAIDGVRAEGDRGRPGAH